MPLKSSKNNQDIQSIHPAPKMRPTALEMAKNQGLDSVQQNKKNKNKKFSEKAAERCVGVWGDAPTSHGGPFPWRWSATSTDVFITYAARLADGPTDRHQRPPRASHWRPTADRLATSDGPTDWRHHRHRRRADRLAARLAAVPVTSDTTSKGPATTSASGKDGPRRQGLAEREDNL